MCGKAGIEYGSARHFDGAGLPGRRRCRGPRGKPAADALVCVCVFFLGRLRGQRPLCYRPTGALKRTLPRSVRTLSKSFSGATFLRLPDAEALPWAPAFDDIMVFLA